MIRHLPLLVLTAFLSGSTLVLPTPSEAWEDDPNTDRWLPSIGIRSEGIVNGREGDVDSVERGFEDGDVRALYWSMGLDMDVLSPTVDIVPLAPRFFVRAGVHMTFDNEDPLANEGNPGTPRIVTIGASRPIGAVKNLGSATRVESRPLAWSAGAGMAFDVEVFDLRFRVKPSIEWMWQKDRLRTALSHAETDSTATVPQCDPCRLLAIDTTTTEEYHSIGPGIELEFTAARLYDDVVMTVFTGFNALALLGNRQTTFRGTGSWINDDGTDPGVPDSTVTSRYDRDTWSYRFGVGVRFRWEPETF